MRQPGIRTDGKTIFVTKLCQFSWKFICLFNVVFSFATVLLYISLCECEKAKPIDKPKKLALNHKNNIQRSLWFFSWLIFSSFFMTLYPSEKELYGWRDFTSDCQNTFIQATKKSTLLKINRRIFVMLPHFYYTFARK